MEQLIVPLLTLFVGVGLTAIVYEHDKVSAWTTARQSIDKAWAEKNGLRSSLLSQIHAKEAELKAEQESKAKLYKALLKANQRVRMLKAGKKARAR